MNYLSYIILYIYLYILCIDDELCDLVETATMQPSYNDFFVVVLTTTFDSTCLQALGMCCERLVTVPQ